MSNGKPRHGLGYFLLILVLGFIVWAHLFELDETVRARGTVIAQERSQIIQVVDGGVLERLNVHEGDVVMKGQELAVLKSERASATLNELRAQFNALEIAKMRASAEAIDVEPDFTLADPELPEVTAAQLALYAENKRTRDEELGKAEETVAIAQDELQTVENLQKLGDASLMELKEKQRILIQAESEVANIRNRYAVEARREIAEIERDISSLKFRIKERENILEQTRILSPVDGIVTVLHINTLGGVLRPSDTLLHIAPKTDEFIIEAKIQPNDIGRLELGLPVLVRLDAFDYTIYGGLKGKLSYVSADTLNETDPTTGRGLTFYRARVTVDPADQDNPKLDIENALKPGIPTSIDINTGRRSVLVFLAKPIARAFSGALTQK